MTVDIQEYAEKMATGLHSSPMDEQPSPTPNASRPVWDLVIEDMRARDQTGRQRYGTPLQTNNGRDALTDAYQEALDLAVYLRQEIEERTQAAVAERERILALVSRYAASLRKVGIDHDAHGRVAESQRCFFALCAVQYLAEVISLGTLSELVYPEGAQHGG